MLATLKGQSVFGIPVGENRLSSLLRPPMLGSNTFTDGGQGPEKPIIEEVDIEEEIFTFPYPEEKGELSDIVNPPIKGIAGKVQSNKSESNRNLSAGTSDFLPYIFVNLDREGVIGNSEPGFIPLTMQSEIANYHTSLLVYKVYTTNAPFYAPNDLYEIFLSPHKTTYDGANKPLYEARFPMPIFSRGVSYLGKEEGIVGKFITPLLSAYLPIDKGMVPNTIQLRHNSVNVPKYEGTLKYEARLPFNLGLDHPLLRDRFIIGLKSEAKEADYQNVDNEVRIHNIKLDTREYTDIGKGGIVQIRSDLRYKQEDITKIQHELELNQCPVIREVNPKSGYKTIQSNPILEEAKPQQIMNISPLNDARLLDFSLDNQPVVYAETRANLDPYCLFNLGDNETQTNYQNNAEVINILLPKIAYRTISNLDNLVRIDYNNGRTQSLSGTTANCYNLDFVDTGLQLQQDTGNSSVVDSKGMFSEQNLEELVEQENELTEKGVNENIQSKIYDENEAQTQEEIYERGEFKEEQETKTNESEDSSVNDLALTAGAVGLSVLAGAAALVGALFKKEDDGAMNSNKPDERLYEPKEEEVEKKCKDTSQCFADTIKWLEGKLKNHTLSNQEYESISQCYAKEIKNIQKAREYIRQREIKKPCGGALYDRFHHVGFKEEQKEKYKLKDYVRNGEIQEGFKLVTTVTAGYNIEGEHGIEAIREDGINEGESDEVRLRKHSAYAQLDTGLRKQGYTPIWKVMSYIDTDTGEKKSGLYLETIAETHAEAKDLLGDKDEYGMKVMGIIILINGIEPGEGTVSMQDYGVKPSDRIEVVFKNDSARYNNNRQLISNKDIEVDSVNYSGTKKYPKKRLDPILV